MALKKVLISLLSVFLLVSCAPAATPTPKVIVVTQEIIVTREVETPTPAMVIVTPTSAPSATPKPAQPAAEALSHAWVDYGGICLRPDNFPPGVQVNPAESEIRAAHLQILNALWAVIEKRGAADQLIPSFTTEKRFIQGIFSDVLVRGPLVLVGKSPPRSDPSSFYLEDAEKIWRLTHPSGTFRGIDLSMICFEFVSPFDFEAEKHNPEYPAYFHLVGGVSHVIFKLEEVFGAPRLAVKLYQSPYGGKREYAFLLGISEMNNPLQNAEAANQHFSALPATLNTAIWGSFDGDGVLEFGFGPKNSDPLPAETFQALKIFVPKP